MYLDKMKVNRLIKEQEKIIRKGLENMNTENVCARLMFKDKKEQCRNNEACAKAQRHGQHFRAKLA